MAPSVMLITCFPASQLCQDSGFHPKKNGKLFPSTPHFSPDLAFLLMNSLPPTRLTNSTSLDFLKPEVVNRQPRDKRWQFPLPHFGNPQLASAATMQAKYNKAIVSWNLRVIRIYFMLFVNVLLELDTSCWLIPILTDQWQRWVTIYFVKANHFMVSPLPWIICIQIPIKPSFSVPHR